MDEAGLENMVRNFLMQLYTNDNGMYQPHIILHGRFPNITAEQLQDLGKSYTGSEVRKAVFDMSSYKALRPDGFQGIFYQKIWHLTRGESGRLGAESIWVLPFQMALMIYS